MAKEIKDKGWGCAGNFHHYHFWLLHSCSDFFSLPLQKSDSVMCMVSSLLLNLSRKTLLTMLHTHWQFVAALLILSVPDPTQLHPSSFLPFLLCVPYSFLCFQLREGTHQSCLRIILRKKLFWKMCWVLLSWALPSQECEVTSTLCDLCSAWDADIWPAVGSWARNT